MAAHSTRPEAVLFDFGGTLLEETGFDLRAGNEWLLSRASRRPIDLTLDAVVERARHIGRQVIARREEVHLEIPWPAISRLIFDYLGVQFSEPLSDLELGFWRAAVRTRPLAGVSETLDRLALAQVRMAIVSNTSFTGPTLRAELGRQGLAHHFEFVMTSAEYSVRKPNPLLFEVAASRLGLPAASIWYVGDRPEADVVGANSAGMISVLLGDRQIGSAVMQAPALTLPTWDAWPHRP
jgi:putative hydrolase of the HAD superfamily